MRKINPTFACVYVREGGQIHTVSIRAVMIPGLESAPEYDWSMILKFVRSDSGSGSFQVDPLESAPVLESAPLAHCWSFLNQAEPVISYFDVQN